MAVENRDPDSAAEVAPAGRLRFRSDRRIKKRSDFQRVYQDGRRIRGRFLTLFYLPQNCEAGPPLPWKLGITATRKTGKAVARNRQKRRVRDFFRVHQNHIPAGWLFVVNTTRALTDAPAMELDEDLWRILGKLETTSAAWSDLGGKER